MSLHLTAVPNSTSQNGLSVLQRWAGSYDAFAFIEIKNPTSTNRLGGQECLAFKQTHKQKDYTNLGQKWRLL